MRPSVYLCIGAGLLVVIGLIGALAINHERQRWLDRCRSSREAVRGLGLSDLALSTEARYTRHPAMSDQVVVVMDHPGAIEHFPSGSFFVPTKP